MLIAAAALAAMAALWSFASQSQAGWLEFTRSGGFAGVNDSLRVSSDGAATYQAQGKPAVRFQLTAEQLASVRSQLAETDWAGLNLTPPSDARDSMSFQLRVDGEQAHWYDLAEPAALSPLRALLESLIPGR